MTAARMVGLVLNISIGMALVATPHESRAQEDPDPNVMKVSLMDCWAQIGGGNLAADGTGSGFGNIWEDRKFHVEFAYHHSSTDQGVKDTAADAIGRIELCWFGREQESQELVAHCPEDWVVFERGGRSVPNANPYGKRVVTCDYRKEPVNHQDPADEPQDLALKQNLEAWVAHCNDTLGEPKLCRDDVGNWVICPEAIGLPAMVMADLDVIPGQFDWGDSGDASSQRGVFMRVFTNDEIPPNASIPVAEDMTYDEILAEANEHGTCANYTVKAEAPEGETPDVQIIAPDRHFKPFGDDVNLCVGSRVVQPGEPYDAPRLLCMPHAGQADYFREVMREIYRTQDERIQRQLPSTERQHAWHNGMRDSEFLPEHVVMVRNTQYVTYSHTSFLPRNIAYSIDPFEDTPASLTNLAGRIDGAQAVPFGVGNISTHEAFHVLQRSWELRNARMGALLFPGRHFSEALPESIMSTACVLNFPNEDAQRCVSSLKILDHESYFNPTHGQYFYNARQRLAVPESDLLLTPNTSGVFWSYVYEQFAYPLPQPDQPSLAHPGGVFSTIQRDPGAETIILRERRYSDEGHDFLGLLFQQIETDSSTTDIDVIDVFDVVDNTLRGSLGRSFADVLFDFHTALYLKDYTDTDPRWRFDWAHGEGFNADSTPAELKPIDVLPGIGGITEDGFVRTRRTRDTWTACSGVDCTPSRVVFAVGDQASGTNVQLGPTGTTMISVSPDPAWERQLITIRVGAFAGDEPRIRIFRVARAGDARTPTPLCGVSPSYECPFEAESNSPRRRVVKNAEVLETTDELLLLASNVRTSGTAHFDWSFGVSDAVLSVIEPTTVSPASIGTPNARRSFAVKLFNRDAEGNAVDIAEEDIQLNVPDCALAPLGLDACVLPQDAVTFVGLGGGYAQFIVQLPAEFYPESGSGDGSLDLEVRSTGHDPILVTNGLRIGADSQATVLVLDASGSMREYGKIEALKTAAAGLIQSLLPPDGVTAPSDMVGIVSFSNDASTLTSPGLVAVSQSSLLGLLAAVAGLEPHDKTSIGDGVFEAQWNLSQTFDALPAADRPNRQVMVVLSDGLQNEPAEPRLYYRTDLGAPPTGDGNGEWQEEGQLPPVLTWPGRASPEAPLPLPNHIETIGIGLDASLGTLGELSALTGDGPMYIPGEQEVLARMLAGGTASVSATALADAMTATYTNGSAYQRALSGEFTSTELEGALPISGIGPGAQELRVVVIGEDAGSRNLVLEGPTGNVEPLAESADSVAFKVQSPQGLWSLRAIPPEPAPTVSWFVEVTVVGPFALHTQVGVAEVTRDASGWNAELPRVGSPVAIRAVPWQERALAEGCVLSATIQDPNGFEKTLALYDDGRHMDASLGDGVYGNLYAGTAESGAYRVDIDASCADPETGDPIVRERRTGFVVRWLPPELDADQDAMPDTWESSFGLDPNSAADAEEDWDADGLSNVEEFRAGTNPLASDTDGGGEADGSEVAYGSNPMDWADDRVSQPVGIPDSGNRVVQILAGMNLGDADFVVQRGPTTEGPFTQLSDVFTSGTDYALDEEVENGTTYCYRVRVESPEFASGWSTPRCVVPGLDSHPPRLDVLGKAQRTCYGDEVAIRLSYADENPQSVSPDNFRVLMGTGATGVEEIRYWAGAGAAAAGLGWLPVTNPLLLSNIDPALNTISVQVRDGAGNVSPIGVVTIPPPAICVTADAGPDQTVECTDEGAAVEMDATNSQGSTSEPLTFSWSASGVAFDDPSSPTAVGWFSPGTTTATVTVANSGGTATDWVDITVVDTTPPTLTVPPDVTVTNCVSPNIGTATASDTCGGVTISNNRPATFPAGLTLVTYTATDSAGNVTTGVQRVITVLADSTACCPPGSHVMMGTSNNDTLIGTSGVDCIVALGGQDTINGMGGNDVINGGEGDDNIQGGSGDDYLWGGNGQDPINGGAGADYIDGGGGDDTCRGGDQNDTIRGGQGQDKLYGENGNDLLFGDDGDDRLEGGYGDDTLNGGGLHDTCLGGPGTDTFMVCQTIQQ